MSYIAVKRLLDVIGSLFLLVLGSPVLLLVAVCIKATSPGPVFYRQVRAGLNRRPFTLYKFRSMRVGDSGDGRLLHSDDRITPFGAIIRRWSVDELPQLFNILRGDMSFVGPRPTMVDQIFYYTDEQLDRLSVRPGLTGLAQVSGRNAIPWAKRIELDLVYVRSLSFRGDLSILLRTVPAAAQSSGLYGHAGNEPYRG